MAFHHFTPAYFETGNSCRICCKHIFFWHEEIYADIERKGNQSKWICEENETFFIFRHSTKLWAHVKQTHDVRLVCLQLLWLNHNNKKDGEEKLVQISRISCTGNQTTENAIFTPCSCSISCTFIYYTRIFPSITDTHIHTHTNNKCKTIQNVYRRDY